MIINNNLFGSIGEKVARQTQIRRLIVKLCKIKVAVWVYRKQIIAGTHIL